MRRLALALLDLADAGITLVAVALAGVGSVCAFVLIAPFTMLIDWRATRGRKSC